MQIYGKFTYTPVSARGATCTEYGLTNDGYQRSDGKYFTNEACTHEVTADEVFKGIFGTLTAGTNGESGYYTLESKTYTLTEDVNTAGYIYVPEGVTATIDLNGHTIDRGLTTAVKNGMVIWVAGNLTVTDSGTGGIIKGGMDNDSYDPVSCVKVYSENEALVIQPDFSWKMAPMTSEMWWFPRFVQTSRTTLSDYSLPPIGTI